MDHVLRTSERAMSAPGFRGWEAEERQALESIRAGGRDPRLDPRVGDWLIGRTERDVVAVWPRPLSIAQTVGQGARPIDPRPARTLPRGTLVRSLKVIDWRKDHVTEELRPDILAFEALVGAGLVHGREWAWHWTCVPHANAPREWLPLDHGPAGDVQQVTWETWRRRVERRTVDVSVWRKWARTARVRRLGAPPAPDRCEKCKGALGYPNSATHHGDPPPCRCA